VTHTNDHPHAHSLHLLHSSTRATGRRHSTLRAKVRHFETPPPSCGHRSSAVLQILQCTGAIEGSLRTYSSFSPASSSLCQHHTPVCSGFACSGLRSGLRGRCSRLSLFCLARPLAAASRAASCGIVTRELGSSVTLTALCLSLLLRRCQLSSQRLWTALVRVAVTCMSTYSHDCR
jgi:hypothetical protein